MRVVFCTTDGAGAFNGINAWLVRFLPGLRARGLDASAWIFPWSRPADCTTLPLLQAAGVPTDAMYPPRTTEASIRWIARQARGEMPDIFVANSVLAPLYASGWLRAAGIPTVAVIHSDDAEYRAKLETFAAGPEFFRVSALVAVSRGLEALAARIAPAVPVECISIGVPAPAAPAAAPTGAALRLVYHGRLAQNPKRILDTARACVRVATRWPQVEADFYGTGPQAEELAAFLTANSAGGRVRFQGSLQPGKAMAVLPRYHVAVLLSDYEGLGLSILEAMACGLVPICTRTANGLPDFLRDGANGFFVADRESAFDTAVERLLREPDTWLRLSSAARATVAERYSEEASLDAWQSLFSRLVADSTAPGAGGPGRPPRVSGKISLPPPHADLLAEDRRYPGWARALWRRIRFNSRV